MGKIHQFHTAVAASYGMFLCGILYVWPSYTISQYTDNNTTLLSTPMMDVDVSLVSSLPALGAMLGTLSAGKIIDFFGRRIGGLILMLPFLSCWILIDLTNSSIVIKLARFVGGFSCGACLVYGPIFISEVSEKSIRGLLASGPIVLYSLGALMSFFFGWFLTYRCILWVNMALCCVGIVIIWMVNESPTWLVRQKRYAEANLAFAHYKGTSPEFKVVHEEITTLATELYPVVESVLTTDEKTSVEAENEKFTVDKEIDDGKEKNMSSLKMILISPTNRRIFIVTGLTISLQVMMGLMVVQVYAKDIFITAVPNLSPHLCSVLLAATILLGTLSSAAFSDRFGRRILLITSAVIVVFCLISMGLLLQTSILPSWVTAVFILIYCYAFKLGAGNVPYILLAEVFIPEIQNVASMILVESVWLFNFIQLGVYPFLVKYFEVHGAFYCYSLFGILNTLVGVFLLPETKGLTNDQIQKLFLGRRMG